MAKLFLSPIVDSLDWKPVKVILPGNPQMKRYTAQYGTLTIHLECTHEEVRKEGWTQTLKFITYREFLVLQDTGYEMYKTGNIDVLEASLAFYSKTKKWPVL